MSSKLSSAMSQKKKKFVPGKDWVWYAPNTHDVFGEPEIKAVTTSLRGGWLTTGKNTALFEAKISKIFGKKYGLFLNSGSSANLLALEILRLPKGAEVITPACNFNTTVSPILRLGLTPVFVDVRPGMYTLDPDALPKALSKKTAVNGAAFDRKLCGPSAHPRIYKKEQAYSRRGQLRYYWRSVSGETFGYVERHHHHKFLCVASCDGRRRRWDAYGT